MIIFLDNHKNKKNTNNKKLFKIDIKQTKKYRNQYGNGKTIY